MRRRDEKSKGGMYIAVFIAFIMISSVIGYMWGQNAPDVQTGSSTYNEFSFIKTQNGWSTKIDGITTEVRFHPAEVEAISFSQNEHALLLKGPIYVSYNPLDENVEMLALAQFELANVLAKKNIQVIPSMSEKNEFGITLANCDTKGTVLLLDFDNATTSITTSGTCIQAKGNPLEIKDRILYDLYGIIK